MRAITDTLLVIGILLLLCKILFHYSNTSDFIISLIRFSLPPEPTNKSMSPSLSASKNGCRISKLASAFNSVWFVIAKLSFPFK
jgi:hypothetical protein